MQGATDAWISMSYGEGLLFTIWLIGLYYLKCRIDSYFSSKKKACCCAGSFKSTVKEALREWESEVEYLQTPKKK
tara:strand:+ start:1261 stop:1485 length:225 start_codon:yes stop_codon:yes gene_type:complete